MGGSGSPLIFQRTLFVCFNGGFVFFRHFSLFKSHQCLEFLKVLQ